MPDQPSYERLDERLDQFDARFGRFEQAMEGQVDRLDASINGRFGRVERRVSDLELAAARAQGAQEERERIGLPVAAPPPPKVPAAAAQQVSETWISPRVRNFVAVLGGFATLLGALGAVLAKASGAG